MLSSLTRRVTLAFAVGLSLATPVAAQSAANPALPVLTHIQAIRTLSQDDGARGYPVRIRATVTHFDEGQATGLLVHDGQFGQFVLPPTRPETTAVWQTLRSGDDIEIEGRTVRGGFAPNVEPDVIRKIRRAPLPSPKNLPYAALLTGRYDCDYVEIEGGAHKSIRVDLEYDPLFLGSFRGWFIDGAHFIIARLKRRLGVLGQGYEIDAGQIEVGGSTGTALNETLAVLSTPP